MADMENYKELFDNDNVIKVLVDHIADLVKIDETERTRKQFQMMELLIYILRNVLLIPYKKNYKNIKEAYKADIQTKLFSQFSQPGGLFDALIYLCQDMAGEFMQRMSLTFLEIFY